MLNTLPSRRGPPWQMCHAVFGQADFLYLLHGVRTRGCRLPLAVHCPVVRLLAYAEHTAEPPRAAMAVVSCICNCSRALPAVPCPPWPALLDRAAAPCLAPPPTHEGAFRCAGPATHITRRPRLWLRIASAMLPLCFAVLLAACSPLVCLLSYVFMWYFCIYICPQMYRMLMSFRVWGSSC